jgi:hypothetical protein
MGAGAYYERMTSGGGETNGTANEWAFYPGPGLATKLDGQASEIQRKFKDAIGNERASLGKGII